MVKELFNRKKPREGEERSVCPHVVIRETEKEFLLEADMPGLSKDDIHVSLERNELVLSGTRHEEVPSGFDPVYCERTPVSYRRTFAIHTEIDQDQMKAAYANGVLLLTLPKSEKVKPKKIAVE